jgi:predicted extracellular nuclease
MSPRRPFVLLAALVLLPGCDLSELRALRDADREPADADRRLIGAVQGRGAGSPLVGREVAIEGRVVRATLGDEDDIGAEVAIAATGELPARHGWFVQDEGDGDPATADGLFVADDGYDTSIGMPGESEYTMRMGTPVRSGDYVKVRGMVVELPQASTGDTPRAAGHRVSRGAPGGTVTAIVAQNIRILTPEDRPGRTAPVPVADDGEHREGMRLAPGR